MFSLLFNPTWNWKIYNSSILEKPKEVLQEFFTILQIQIFSQSQEKKDDGQCLIALGIRRHLLRSAALAIHCLYKSIIVRCNLQQEPCISNWGGNHTPFKKPTVHNYLEEAGCCASADVKSNTLSKCVCDPSVNSSGAAGSMLAAEWRVLQESAVQTDLIVISTCTVDFIIDTGEKAPLDSDPDWTEVNWGGFLIFWLCVWKRRQMKY